MLSLDTCACKGFPLTYNSCHCTLVLAEASDRHAVAVTGDFCMQGLHTDTRLLSLDREREREDFTSSANQLGCTDVDT